jgi:hypothetical protein
MPTNESLELCGALEVELQLPLLTLIVNQVVPELFMTPQRDALAALEEPVADDAASLALAAGIRRAAREQVQSQSLERLAALGVPCLRLPFLIDGATRPAAVSQLVETLARASQQ